jgi:peptide/nickel transport system permease protein
MLRYLGKRSLHSLVSLVGLVVLVFFLARLTGDPTNLYLPIDASPAEKANFAQVHGFNDPVLLQFWHFVQGAVRLDFGASLRYQRPALDLVLEAFPTTLELAFFAMLIALVIAIVTGSLAAWRLNGFFDRIASIISLISASIPNFWIAIVGVLVLAVNLRLIPTSGTGSVQQWILPVAVLAIRPAGLIVQVVRGSMTSALSSAYVKTARAKGVSSRAIIFVHALRNAMLPVITVAGDQATGMVNGAVIVETIFGFPGIGNLMLDAITNRDFAVVQAAVMVTAIAIFILNIVIDLCYAALDPRIRFT